MFACKLASARVANKLNYNKFVLCLSMDSNHDFTAYRTFRSPAC